MAETKRCSRCGIERPVEDYYENPAYRDGRMGWCKPCVSLRSSSATALLRVAALLALGGTCKHCGTDDLRVLVIDHPRGSGRADRAGHGSSRKFYQYVAEHPEEYQALCHNANHLKRLEAREHRRGAYSEVIQELPPFDAPDRSVALARRWQDPEYRSRQRTSMAGAWTDERRSVMHDRAEFRRQALISAIEINRQTARSGNWGGGFEACLGCGRVDRRHKAHGVCGTCNATVRRDAATRARRAQSARAAAATKG